MKINYVLNSNAKIAVKTFFICIFLQLVILGKIYCVNIFNFRYSLRYLHNIQFIIANKFPLTQSFYQFGGAAVHFINTISNRNIFLLMTNNDDSHSIFQSLYILHNLLHCFLVQRTGKLI